MSSDPQRLSVTHSRRSDADERPGEPSEADVCRTEAGSSGMPLASTSGWFGGSASLKAMMREIVR